MTTFNFLYHYIKTSAEVSIINEYGETIYNGKLKDMPVKAVNNTTFHDVWLGKGSIIIIVKSKGLKKQ